MVELTAMQKVRFALTGDPQGEPHFQHEGEPVVRWISSGTGPNAYVLFRHQGLVVDALCPSCGVTLGSFLADYGDDTGQQIAIIQHSTHQH